MIRHGLGNIALLLLLILAYSVAYGRGYRKGMFDQWMTSELLSYTLWHGTGEDDGAPAFPGLAEFMKKQDAN